MGRKRSRRIFYIWSGRRIKIPKSTWFGLNLSSTSSKLRKNFLTFRFIIFFVAQILFFCINKNKKHIYTDTSSSIYMVIICTIILLLPIYKKICNIYIRVRPEKKCTVPSKLAIFSEVFLTDVYVLWNYPQWNTRKITVFL